MNERALYESLQVIRNADQFSDLREWLKDQRERSRDRLETTDDPVERGVAQTYRKILGLIEGAPETLEKIVTSSKP